MSTPPQLGGYEWRAAVAEARQALDALRRSLKQAMQRSHSPATKATLGTAALALAELEAAVRLLDDIGQRARENRRK